MIRNVHLTTLTAILFSAALPTTVSADWHKQSALSIAQGGMRSFPMSELGLTRPFDPNNPTSCGMQKTFGDEFDELSASDLGPGDGKRWMNHLFWRLPVGYVVGKARCAPECLSVANGLLTIEARRYAGQWFSGTLESTAKTGAGFNQKFGYFEASMRAAPGPGFNSGFWLLSNDAIVHAESLQPEMDVVEVAGLNPQTFMTTLHRDSRHHKTDVWTKDNKTMVNIDLTKTFHRYGMLWAPGDGPVSYYFDGQLVKSVPKYDTIDSGPQAALISLEVYQGGWTGAPDPDCMRTSMDVDYVRVWQFPKLTAK